MSLYTKHRTHSKEAEERKIAADRLYYEMFFKKGMKILDIGCSTGTFELNDPKNIVGLDIDKDAIKIAKKKGLDCRHYDVSSNKLPFKNSAFDAVYCRSVFAHIRNHISLLKEIKRVLKQNGKIIIHTADVGILKFKFFEDYTHVSPFTKESLKHLLYDAGFRNYKVYNLPIRMPGMGFLHRNGILPATKILLIEMFILNFSITSKLFCMLDSQVGILAEVYKNQHQ